ncbi:MAG TPA: O-methyltransferase [Gemmatimonadales bacterium]|nr:O-methyltransferase [Gemmatimonadales bacterium]
MSPRDLNLVHPDVERYVASLVPRRDAVMREMEARARREGIPIVGPVVGRLFCLLALAGGAKRVMELGSAIGYSTLWWARAVGPHGKVWYTDASPANARDAEAYLRRGGVLGRVKLLVGDALESMARVKGRFDIVFCDIDKPGYPAAYRAAMRRLRPGGLLVVDNTLWKGRVTRGRASARRDPATAGVQALNRLAFASDRGAFATLIPLRDGVTVVVKR